MLSNMWCTSPATINMKIREHSTPSFSTLLDRVAAAAAAAAVAAAAAHAFCMLLDIRGPHHPLKEAHTWAPVSAAATGDAAVAAAAAEW